jgi:hypothetical protein
VIEEEVHMAIARWMIVGTALLTGTVSARAAPALKDENAKRSYALGMGVGAQLKDQSVEVDPELYKQGLADGLNGARTLLSKEEARAVVQRMQAELKQRRVTREKPRPAAPAAIQVSFKLDPRLTKSLYMGERWAPAATYTSASTSDPRAITLHARARSTVAPASKFSPTWSPSNPAMVAISPVQGAEVTLSVRSAGESTVTVKHGGASSTFAVKTVGEGDSWRVDVSAVQPKPLPDAATAAAAGATARQEDRR